jgi:EpsD family peptidyl-prolyl cis-trans isomerase
MRRMIALFALAGLSACDHGGDVPNGQVLATVGKREITASQFQDALQALPPGRDPHDPLVKAAVLRQLVDVTLLAEGGVAAGVDKKPEVARRIEAARRAILASAFVDQGVSLETSPADLRTFYADHPTRFAHRNRYEISDIAVAGDKAQRARAVALFNAPHATLEGTRGALQKLGIPNSFSHRVAPSDQLPQPVAERFAPMRTGAMFSLDAGSIEHLGRVDRITPDPVPFETALPALRADLVRLRVQQQTKAKLAAMRDSLPVEYGELGSEVVAARTEQPLPTEESNMADWPH